MQTYPSETIQYLLTFRREDLLVSVPSVYSAAAGQLFRFLTLITSLDYNSPIE